MVRHKNRYIVVSITENDADPSKHLRLKTATLSEAIIEKVQYLYGDFGVAAIRAGFTSKYCNDRTKIGIVKVRHGPHKFITSSIPFISTLEKRPVVISIIHIGATIKQCFNFLLDYQRKRYYDFVATLKTDEEKAMLNEEIMNLDKVLSIV